MGILDNKSRVLDVIVTTEGRRQIAAGDLRVKYVSFSDATAFYTADAVSGSADVTNRIYLESTNLPQDQIVFEADDSGNLMPFPAGTDVSLLSGRVISASFSSLYSTTISGSSKGLTILTGAFFASQMGDILSSSIDNFQKLLLIGSQDQLFEDDGFAVGPNRISFTINDTRPIANKEQFKLNTVDMESLFSDPRLANVPNFKYLPPINKLAPTTPRNDVSFRQEIIADYAPWGNTTLAKNKNRAYRLLRQELSYYESTGFCKTVSFEPTSRANTLVGQMFELTHDLATKLDVIHYGKYANIGNSNSMADVFFAGKVVTDDNGTQTFIHMFTLIFE